VEVVVRDDTFRLDAMVLMLKYVLQSCGHWKFKYLSLQMCHGEQIRRLVHKTIGTSAKQAIFM
jgi:hypothetical protein